jgi:hypothetical protein
MGTSDVIASGCSRNTIAAKIYYLARRLNEAKTNKLRKNERSSKEQERNGGRKRERGHAGVYNRNTGAKVVN